MAKIFNVNGLAMFPVPISSWLKVSALAILLAATTGFAHAGFFSDSQDDIQNGGRFINRKSEGWFWYEVEPEPVEPVEDKKEETPIVITEQAQTKETTPAEPVEQGPQPLSTAWLRVNLPKYLDVAIDNPTIENVKAYQYLQRLVSDRAQQFSDTWELAMVGDPLIDEINRRPTSSYANRAIDNNAYNEQTRLISSIAEKAGIFFFFSSDCQTCELQAPIIKALADNTGFSVVPISTDGIALSNNTFPDFKTDQGQARRLGVQTLPATVLVSPNGTFEVIGQGALALSELNQRIMIAARRNNWVSEDDYNKTRPILNMDLNLAELANQEIMKQSIEKNSRQRSSPDEDLISPSEIVDMFRNALNEKQ